MMRSLYSGVSGLKSFGVGMSSISNNISNVNTVAFKNAMTLYSDMTSQTVSSSSSNGITEHSQVGMGVTVGVNRTMFQEGSFMAGSSATDLAISGMGFFGLEKNGVVQYGRAGNFRFTKEGDLVDPNGYSLMSHKVVDGVVSPTAEPTKLDLSENGLGYMKPRATSGVNLIENLGSRNAQTSVPGNQFFGLTAAWNGQQSPPLSSNQYSHVGGVTVYDAEGSRQELNVYYDYAGTQDGKPIYKYVIGTDPNADGSARAGTASAGLMAAGTITFSPMGQIQDMTMFTAPEGGNASDLSAWKPASFDENGSPVFSANFLGKGGASLGAQNISVNLGIKMDGKWSENYTSAADVNANPTGLANHPGRTPEAKSCTAYAGGSGTVTASQDGYASGNITTLTVDPDGFMIGKYTNGQTQQLVQIPLHRFANEEGLRHEGGNRYSSSVESGAAQSGFPTTENYGSLNEATLEQSNVDLAREFATMIMTQRGFQMNSKMVTTSDQLLQKAVELKR